jgi:hypothetical protein
MPVSVISKSEINAIAFAQTLWLMGGNFDFLPIFVEILLQNDHN